MLIIRVAHVPKQKAMTKSSTLCARFSIQIRYGKKQELTERKWRGGEAQIDTAIIRNIRQTLGDEEGVLRVEMHHLLGWGRSARSEASGRAGRFLLLELLLRAVHAEIGIVLLLLLLTCELRPLHSVVGRSGVGISGGVRCSSQQQRRPAIFVSFVVMLGSF